MELTRFEPDAQGWGDGVFCGVRFPSWGQIPLFVEAVFTERRESDPGFSSDTQGI